MSKSMIRTFLAAVFTLAASGAPSAWADCSTTVYVKDFNSGKVFFNQFLTVRAAGCPTGRGLRASVSINRSFTTPATPGKTCGFISQASQGVGTNPAKTSVTGSSRASGRNCVHQIGNVSAGF